MELGRIIWHSIHLKEQLYKMRAKEAELWGKVMLDDAEVTASRSLAADRQLGNIMESLKVDGISYKDPDPQFVPNEAFGHEFTDLSHSSPRHSTGSGGQGDRDGGQEL